MAAILKMAVTLNFWSALVSFLPPYNEFGFGKRFTPTYTGYSIQQLFLVLFWFLSPCSCYQYLCE